MQIPGLALGSAPESKTCRWISQRRSLQGAEELFHYAHFISMVPCNSRPPSDGEASRNQCGLPQKMESSWIDGPHQVRQQKADPLSAFIPAARRAPFFTCFFIAIPKNTELSCNGAAGIFPDMRQVAINLRGLLQKRLSVPP